MEPKQSKKPKEMDPDSEEWESAANELARSFAPTIYPCQHCYGPVVKGYCCQRCGSASPGPCP